MAFPGDYTKYQEVTIDSGEVGSDLTDFPVYVDLSDLSKAGADIFDTCRSDGGDIRVTKSDGTTELPREVVTIDTTGKTGELHFKFSGTLSSSSDTTVRIWYNGTDTEPAADATYGSENVWSDYVSVWHFTEASGNVYDSTSTDDTGVATGTPTYQQSSKIGNNSAVSLDADTDYFNLANGTPNLDASNTFTLTAWASLDSDQAANVYGQGDASSSTPRFYFGMGGGSYRRNDRLRDTDSDQLQTLTAGSPNLSDNGWHYLAMVRTSGSLVSYTDTTAIETNTATNPDNFTALDRSTIGNGGRNSYTLGWDGKIDELRLRQSELSTDWMDAEYSNQNAPGSFYTVGDEVESGGGGGGTAFSQAVVIA